MGEGKPTLTAYKFDESCFHDADIKLLNFQTYNREWAEFVLNNRRNRTRTPSHSYDIVIGPIANDTVGYQIRRFTSGLIDMERFIEELKFMKGVTMQYFFATEKAIRYLTKIERL